MIRYEAVLFDFDGVLGRTGEDNAQAWEFALNSFGLEFDRDEYFLIEGVKSSDYVEEVVSRQGKDPALAQKVLAAKHEYYRAHNSFSFYDGVREIVGSLKARACPIALVSGGSRKRLFSQPSQEFLEQFNVVITGEDCTKSKPAPEPYLKAAQKLGVEPQNCLVLENAPLGIAAAKRAGMYCIAIASTLARFHLSDADMVVDDIRELENMFANQELPSQNQSV